jgi:hypothetical protein
VSDTFKEIKERHEATFGYDEYHAGDLISIIGQLIAIHTTAQRGLEEIADAKGTYGNDTEMVATLTYRIARRTLEEIQNV